MHTGEKPYSCSVVSLIYIWHSFSHLNVSTINFCIFLFDSARKVSQLKKHSTDTQKFIPGYGHMFAMFVVKSSFNRLNFGLICSTILAKMVFTVPYVNLYSIESLDYKSTSNKCTVRQKETKKIVIYAMKNFQDLTRYVNTRLPIVVSVSADYLDLPALCYTKIIIFFRTEMWSV